MNHSLRIIRVPYDSGHHQWRMGAGPAVLAGPELLEILPADTVVRDVELTEERRYEMATTLTLHRLVALEIAASQQAGELPIVFSGNCNVPAIGAAAGSDSRIGCVWFDAHGDFNTAETTPSGFVDGMALSILTGSAWQKAMESVPGFAPIEPADVILVGARDLDPEEEQRLRGSEINWIPPDRLASLDQALDRLSGRTDAVYLHLDVDVLDPGELTANEYAAAGGIALDQLLESIGWIDRRFEIVAAGIAAYDPASDEKGNGPSVVMSVIEELIGARP